MGIIVSLMPVAGFQKTCTETHTGFEDFLRMCVWPCVQTIRFKARNHKSSQNYSFFLKASIRPQIYLPDYQIQYYEPVI